MNLQKLFLCVPNLLKLPNRTTVILKRRVPIKPFRKHIDSEFIKNKLDPLHFEYEVVDSGKDKQYPDVEIILNDIIEDVGKKGQIVKINSENAYEYIMFSKAFYATPENIAKVKKLADSEVDKYSSLTAYKTMKLLKNRVLSVYMNMYEPWTIEPWHIRVNYRLDGIQILNDNCIELPNSPISGPNMAWEGKDFAIFITINNCERFPVRCRLRHYTKIYSDRIILPPDHFCIPSEPILPEQKELLDSIPLPEWHEEEKFS